MDWQPVLNLIIPLASAIAVVLISSRANVRLKRLDVEQRQADHEQEFRKLYATKRIEAAEQYIGRLVAIINKLDLLRVGLLTTRFEEESDNTYSTRWLEKSEELQAAADAISAKSLNTAYLYFDEAILEQKTDSVAALLVLAEKQFVDAFTEKRKIWGLFNEADGDSPRKQELDHAHHEKEAELTRALETYNQCILDYRAYLVGICGALRNDLAAYGLVKTG